LKNTPDGSSNLDETDREYSLAPTDDLIRLWRSEVKVTAGHGKGIHVDAEVCLLIDQLIIQVTRVQGGAKTGCWPL